VIVSTALLCCSPTTHAQPIQELDPLVVTGSRLNRIDLEDLTPTTMISRDEIEHSGQISIAGILRQQITNSFGSFTPTSGTGNAQGSAQINLRGLGAQRTLVLIDGRRLPNSPAFGGASQNLNSIPLEMIDHIEILRDGASAIYGSDAIAGVVNLVTRRNYNGLQLRGQFDSPYGGGGDTYTAALSGGRSNDASQLYFGVEHYSKDIIYSRDRAVLRDLSSAIGYPGTIYQYDAQNNVVPQASNPDANGNPRNFRPFDDCPTGGFDSSVAFPDSSLTNGVCRYRVGAATGLTAGLHRSSLNAGGQYPLDTNTRTFGHLLMTRSRSTGILSPVGVDTMISGINAPDANGNIGIRMAPDNPNNPNPGSTLVINYRPTVLGVRETEVDDRVYQTYLGLRGRIDTWIFNDWETAVSFNDYRQYGRGRNHALASKLQAAVDEGSFNPFAPDAAVTDTFRYTTHNDRYFTSAGIDGNIRSSFNWGALPLASVWGAEYRRDRFSTISDAEASQSLSFAGDGSINGFKPSNVLGATGGSAVGQRVYKSLFMETATHLPDHKLELSIALRFDQYNDVGNTHSPKFSFGYRPYNKLLLRGSYGKGFRAPELASMYGAPTRSNVLVLDRLACRDDPGGANACSNNVQAAIFDSNPELRAEKSRNLMIGLVWNPATPLTLTADYYAIKVDQAITQLSPQSVIDNELRCADAGRRCDARSEGNVVRNEAGGLLLIYSPAINAAILQTRGLDLSATYEFGIQGHGRYRLTTRFERTLSYRRKDNDSAPLLERLDTLNAGGDIFPKFRSNATLDWTLDRFNARLALNYISKVSDCDAPDRYARRPACNNDFEDYRTIDVQFGYDTPWRQSITLGVRNLFNEAPQVSRYVQSAALPGVFLALHDSEQRVLYLRLTQRF